MEAPLFKREKRVSVQEREEIERTLKTLQERRREIEFQYERALAEVRKIYYAEILRANSEYTQGSLKRSILQILTFGLINKEKEAREKRKRTLE